VAGIAISFFFVLTRISLKEVKGEAGKDYTYDSTFQTKSFNTYRSKRVYFLRYLTNDKFAPKAAAFAESLRS